MQADFFPTKNLRLLEYQISFRFLKKNLSMVSITSSSVDRQEKKESNDVQNYKNPYRSNSCKSEWCVESILTGMGIEEDCVQLFMDKAIDIDTFVILEEDDLVEIGVQDTATRERIMEGVRNCQLRRCSQNTARNQFSVVDGTRVLVSCANQLDSLCNLLKYTRQRLNRRPVINQYLYGQYSASEGAREITLALLTHIRRLNVEAQELQQMMRQEGETPKAITRLREPHDIGRSRLLTSALIIFPILFMFTAWKMKIVPFRT